MTKNDEQAEACPNKHEIFVDKNLFCFGYEFSQFTQEIGIGFGSIVDEERGKFRLKDRVTLPTNVDALKSTSL